MAAKGLNNGSGLEAQQRWWRLKDSTENDGKTERVRVNNEERERVRVNG